MPQKSNGDALGTAQGPGQRTVFLTGGSGFMGRRLAERLLVRGHHVIALARASSAARLPRGVQPVIGDALDHRSFAAHVKGCDTFVQLIGTPHPSPAKAQQFVDIDLESARESLAAAKAAAIRHFVYVSVAHPAPIMNAYINVRTTVETELRAAGIPATVLRPWYVLGPGRWWPYLLVPFYRLLELLPSTRDSARRLGLVSLEDMISTLLLAVEYPAKGFRVVDVPGIKARSLG